MNTDMNKLELLLYIGNKKVKQLRDRRQEIKEYLFEGGAEEEQKDLEEALHEKYYFEAFDDGGCWHDCDDCQEYYEETGEEELCCHCRDNIEHTAKWDAEHQIKDKVSDLHSELSDLLDVMSAFYKAKSETILANADHFTPVGWHEIGCHSWRYGYSTDFFILFKGENHTFHMPQDDIPWELQDQFDDLPELGELDQISSELMVDCEECELTVEEITEKLNELLG